MCPDFRVNIDSFDLDEARFAIAEHGSCNRPFSSLCHNRYLDVSIKCARFVLICGGNLNATLFGDKWSADKVHIRI